MTKAQRETLFDYYTKYGMKQEANALYEEDDDDDKCSIYTRK